MREIGKIVKDMEKVYKLLWMEAFMMGNGKKVRKMEKANLLIKMALIMKASGYKINIFKSDFKFNSIYFNYFSICNSCFLIISQYGILVFF